MTRRTRSMLSLASGLALALLTSSAGRLSATAQTRAVVDVSAERFTFTPSEIKVKAGTVLEIRLRSEDTDHGFRIAGTRTDVRIPKRNKGLMVVVFEATTPGRYAFECSHVCGAGHSFMRGAIVVTE